MFADMTLFALLLKGGWMLLFILIASVIAVAIIIERYLTYKKVEKNSEEFTSRIFSLLDKNDVKSAVEFCKESPSHLSEVIVSGLTKINLPHERISEAVESAAKREVFNLEKGLSTLATISGVAPLLGFLGTVTGMIQAFMQIQDLQGVVNPSDLAGGIWEALITTAFGLAVGIIALAAYNYFVSQVKKIVLDMETFSNDVLDKIYSSKEQ
jgi:biopolymer transport protein ExbB